MKELILTADILDRIDEYDWKHFRRDERNKNRTRFYKWLNPSGNDIEIHTIAVKTRKDRQTIEVKAVVMASVDSERFRVRDLVFAGMAGYQVDWSREKLGKCYYWCDNRVWASEAYKKGGMWRVYGKVINDEVLDESERFQYCQWSETHEDILDYLKMYVAHPRIEFLVKAGVPRFSVMPGFVRQLERDKKFMAFFFRHIEEIKRSHYGADVIRKAYRMGISFSDADKKIDDRREFRNDKLPAGIDASKAIEYVRKAKSYTREYCNYLNNCVRLGLDIADTKNAFPKQLKKRIKVVQDEIKALETKENAEKAKKMAEDLRSVALKWVKLEKLRGKLCVVVPKCEAEFENEEKHLHNCLFKNHYAHKMARGESIVVFVRLSETPTVPFVAVEYSPDEQKIMQCYGAKNSKPPADVLKFVETRLLKAAKKAIAV